MEIGIWAGICFVQLFWAARSFFIIMDKENYWVGLVTGYINATIFGFAFYNLVLELKEFWKL